MHQSLISVVLQSAKFRIDLQKQNQVFYNLSITLLIQGTKNETFMNT